MLLGCINRFISLVDYLVLGKGRLFLIFVTSGHGGCFWRYLGVLIIGRDVVVERCHRTSFIWSRSEVPVGYGSLIDDYEH